MLERCIANAKAAGSSPVTRTLSYGVIGLTYLILAQVTSGSNPDRTTKMFA